MKSACPSDEQLNGNTAVAADDWVAAHLDDCAACQRRLDRMLAEESVPSWAHAALGQPAEPQSRGPDAAFLALLRELVPRAASSSTHLLNAAPNGTVPEVCPTRLGQYEILGEIGRGGMAVVYKARQPHLDRVVALKRLRIRDHDDADVARFLREAESVARVQHPNIVQVFEVGGDGGRPFLAMEFIAGGSLAEYLSGGATVEPRAAAAFVEKVARAVHQAHGHGVIHRDLKPANILLAAAGDPPHRPGRRPALDAFEPKVADFGLARRVDDDRGLTQPDMLAGTPAYLAPEQLTRASGCLSPACDIYALGVILYEMLTGRPPLVGPTALATLRLVESVEPVAPRRLQPQLPRDLEAVCLKCLTKDPQRRYANADDLADDLARFLAGQPTVARPLNAVARGVKFIGRHPWATGAVALVLLAGTSGFAAVLWQWREAETARGNLQVALDAEATHPRDAEENLYYGRLAQAAAIWESGEAAQARTLLAACQPTDGRIDLRGWEWHYLNRQFRPETHVVPLTHWVNELIAVPAADGEAQEMAVAIGRPLMNATDRTLPGDGVAGFLRHRDPNAPLRPGPSLPGAATKVAVHPAAKYVAWGTNTGHIVLGRGTTAEVARAIATPAPVTGLAFSADGSMLFATGDDVHLRAFDPETGDLRRDELVRVGRPMLLAVHPAGELVACGGWTGVVRLFDAKDWRAVGDLTGHPGGVTSLSFSADGAVLAVGCRDGSVVLWDSAARRELRRIPSHGGPAYAVALRSDGKALAVGGADRTVRMFDPLTERLLATYRGHESSVRSLSFRDDRLLSGGQDGTVRVWDATKDVRGRLLPFSNKLNDAAFRPSPDGLQFVAASTKGFAQAWSASAGRSVGRCDLPIAPRPAYPRRYAAFLKGGHRLAGIDKDDRNAVSVCDALTGQRIVRLPSGAGPVQVLAADHTGTLLAWATAVTDGGIDLHWCDPDAATQPPPIRLSALGLMALAIDPMRGQLAAVTVAGRPGGEQSLWVFDLVGARPPREVVVGTSMFGGLAFSPDGSFLAVAVGDAVDVYRSSTWERAHRMLLPPSTTCLAFSPDGRRLAAVGYDGNATLFDPVAGKRVFQLRSLAPSRPDDMAADARVAFSPDGEWLLSTNWDGSVNLWDGRPIRD